MIRSTTSAEHDAGAILAGRQVHRLRDGVQKGRAQVIVEPLPIDRERAGWYRKGAGAEPHWRADGRELVYLSADGWLMSVAIPANRAFTPSTPQRLFQVTVPELFGPADSTISRDGKRFVVNKLVAYPNVPSIHVVANWPALLKR